MYWKRQGIYAFHLSTIVGKTLSFRAGGCHDIMISLRYDVMTGLEK